MVPCGLEEMVAEDFSPGEQAGDSHFQPLFYCTFSRIFEERPKIAIGVKDYW